MPQNAVKKTVQMCPWISIGHLQDETVGVEIVLCAPRWDAGGRWKILYRGAFIGE